MSDSAKLAVQRSVAASMVYEAKVKEHQAACWLGLPNNIEEARGNLHAALDASLDATENQITHDREGTASLKIGNGRKHENHRQDRSGIRCHGACAAVL